LHELRRGLARLQQIFRHFRRQPLQRAEALGFTLAPLLDLQARKLDRADHQDAGDAEQQDLPAQAEMQPAADSAKDGSGLANEFHTQWGHRDWRNWK
jgi:hypothetical protein